MQTEQSIKEKIKQLEIERDAYRKRSLKAEDASEYDAYAYTADNINSYINGLKWVLSRDNSRE